MLTIRRTSGITVPLFMTSKRRKLAEAASLTLATARGLTTETKPISAFMTWVTVSTSNSSPVGAAWLAN